MLLNIEKLLKNRRKEQFEKKMMLGDRYSGNYVFVNDFGEPWWDTAIRVIYCLI